MNQLDLQIGGRIKRLRRQKSVSQAQLAEALEISASYLNLIEHNRRRITVPLLFRVAGYFGVEPGELAESDDARLSGEAQTDGRHRARRRACGTAARRARARGRCVGA